MSFWIQHGYGKGDKIDRLAQSGQVAGVVLSPADEDRESLRALARRLAAAGVELMLDPQLYVYSIDGGVGRCHDTHGLEFPDVRWSASARTVAAHVDAVLAANRDLGINQVIAPSPLQSAFLDSWASVALQYARTAAEMRPDAAYASLVIDERAFGAWDFAEEWLDEASQLDVLGFYVIAARSDGEYPSAWDTNRLANYFRLVYRLLANDYKVLAGYSDLEGLAMAAIGAGNASGWFYSHRRFAESKWRPSVGGRAAIPRVLSERLLVPLQLAEAVRILRSSAGDRFTRDAELRASVLDGGWGISQSRYQHLSLMAKLTELVTQPSEQRERVTSCLARLTAAETHLTYLEERGLLPAAPSYVRVVRSVRDALQSAQAQESTS